MRIYAIIFFFFEQKTAYEMRISDWSSDVCSSDLDVDVALDRRLQAGRTVISEIDTVLMCSEIVADVGGQIGVVLDEQRSKERRVGKECVSTCRSRWSP